MPEVGSPALWFPVSFALGRPDASASFRGVVGENVGAYAAELNATRFDSRFIPAGVGSRVAWHFVVCPLEGDLRVGGRRVEQGQVCVVRDKMLTAAGEPTEMVRSYSPSLRVALLRVRHEDLRESTIGAGSVQTCSAKSYAAFRALSSALEVKDFSKAHEGISDLVGTLDVDRIVALQSRGHGSASTAHEGLTQRLAATVFPLLSELVTRPMLVDVVARAGIGERQFLRNMVRVQEHFDLLDRGWRSSIVRWRATSAVMLAACPHLAFDEVAQLAGYSSTSAMHRALRSFRLPTPLKIREAANQDS